VESLLEIPDEECGRFHRIARESAGAMDRVDERAADDGEIRVADGRAHFFRRIDAEPDRERQVAGESAHAGQEFLRERKLVRPHPVPGRQQPPRAASLERVQKLRSRIAR